MGAKKAEGPLDGAVLGRAGRADILGARQPSHPLPRTRADRAVTAAVEGGEAAVSGYTMHRVTPFNPVDKKTLAEVRADGARDHAVVLDQEHRCHVGDARGHAGYRAVTVW